MERRKIPENPWGEMDLLADPIRRAIFFKLIDGPMSVGALVAALPVTQSAVSQHLKKMKVAGFVGARREGKFTFYAANPAVLNKLLRQLDILRGRLMVQMPSSEDASEDAGRNAPIMADAIDTVMDNWGAQWEPKDPLTLGIVIRLHLIAEILKNNLTRTAAQIRFNSMELNLLATMERGGPPYESTLTGLSQQLQRSLPVISRYVNRAVKNQFISRIPNGRSNILRLTDKGREILHQIIEHQREKDLAKIYQMPSEQRQLIAQVTRDLLANLVP